MGTGLRHLFMHMILEHFSGVFRNIHKVFSLVPSEPAENAFFVDFYSNPVLAFT